MSSSRNLQPIRRCPPTIARTPDGFAYDMYQTSVRKVQQIMSDPIAKEETITIVQKLCAIFPAPFSTLCDDLVAQYVRMIIKYFDEDISHHQIYTKIHSIGRTTRRARSNSPTSWCRSCGDISIFRGLSLGDPLHICDSCAPPPREPCESPISDILSALLISNLQRHHTRARMRTAGKEDAVFPVTRIAISADISWNNGSNVGVKSILINFFLIETRGLHFSCKSEDDDFSSFKSFEYENQFIFMQFVSIHRLYTQEDNNQYHHHYILNFPFGH